MKLVEDNEKKYQEEQKITEDEEINDFHSINESDGIGLQKEECKMSVCEPISRIYYFISFNKDISDQGTYIPRMYVHSGEKCYTCNICTKTFSS